MPHPALPDFPITVQHPLHWGEMDAFGHLNNAMFFRHFESARIAYFEAIGWLALLARDGVGPILAETSCRFRRPITFPDHLVVGATAHTVTDGGFGMRYAIFSEAQQTVAATGDGRIASIDTRSGKKAPLPDPIRAAIAQIEGTRS